MAGLGRESQLELRKYGQAGEFSEDTQATQLEIDGVAV
jgi:hypothetical protein